MVRHRTRGLCGHRVGDGRAPGAAAGRALGRRERGRRRDARLRLVLPLAPAGPDRVPRRAPRDAPADRGGSAPEGPAGDQGRDVRSRPRGGLRLAAPRLAIRRVVRDLRAAGRRLRDGLRLLPRSGAGSAGRRRLGLRRHRAPEPRARQSVRGPPPTALVGLVSPTPRRAGAGCPRARRPWRPCRRMHAAARSSR